MIQLLWECWVTLTELQAARMKHDKSSTNCFSCATKNTPPPIHWPLLLWVSVIGMKYSTGWKKAIVSATAITSTKSASIRFSRHCAVIRVSKRSPRTLFQRGNSGLLQNEGWQFLAGDHCARRESHRRLHQIDG